MVVGGIQFVGGNCYYCVFFDILVMFLYFFIQFLVLMFVNFSCCYYYQWNGIYWFIFGVNKLVIYGNDFYIVVMCFCDDGRVEFGVWSINNEIFCVIGSQVVDCV